MAHISILGGGAWGCALYHALSQKNNCQIVSRRQLDLTFRQCSFEESLLHATYMVIAISSEHLRGFLSTHPLPKDSRILIATKGIEENSGAFVSDILESFHDRQNLAYLTGPSFAKEVIQKLPCALMIHAHNPTTAHAFQVLFPSYMRIYTGDDVIGGEIAGAYKNVLAIAGGICEGLKLGQNAKASLLARGLVEMERFGRVFGAKMETFLGLSGAGDLFLSANSTLSRNYRVGLGLAQGRTLACITEEIGEIAEGVKTSRAIEKLRKKHQIYTPIATEIAYIIQGKDAKTSLKDILSSKT